MVAVVSTAPRLGEEETQKDGEGWPLASVFSGTKPKNQKKR
jgi:hypothetical protein